MRAETVRELTSKGQQTRLRLVSAAAQLMTDRGVAGTTLEHVRAAAGVSSSQIYHYFADKEALVRAVIDYQNESIVGRHEAAYTRIDSLAGLRAWRDFVVDRQRELGCKGGCPLGGLGSQLAEVDPLARADVAAGFTRWEAAIRTAYQAMHATGALRAEVDHQTLATATLAALQGGLLLSQVLRSTQPLEAALDTVFDYVATLSD